VHFAYLANHWLVRVPFPAVRIFLKRELKQLIKTFPVVGQFSTYWPASTPSAPNRAGNCKDMLNFMFSSSRNERQVADGGIGVSLKQNSTHIEVVALFIKSCREVLFL
jgi:hypothetical protein